MATVNSAALGLLVDREVCGSVVLLEAPVLLVQVAGTQLEADHVVSGLVEDVPLLGPRVDEERLPVPHDLPWRRAEQCLVEDAVDFDPGHADGREKPLGRRGHGPPSPMASICRAESADRARSVTGDSPVSSSILFSACA